MTQHPPRAGHIITGAGTVAHYCNALVRPFLRNTDIPPTCDRFIGKFFEKLARVLEERRRDEALGLMRDFTRVKSAAG